MRAWRLGLLAAHPDAHRPVPKQSSALLEFAAMATDYAASVGWLCFARSMLRRDGEDTSGLDEQIADGLRAWDARDRVLNGAPP